MAMNKKEREELEAAKTVAALRWTAPVHTDVPPPEPSTGGETNGWDFNSHSMRVRRSWSTCISHGEGESNDRRYGSAAQGGVHLFSTRLLALRAMRHQIERTVAATLRSVDRMIEEELAKGTEGGEQK